MTRLEIALGIIAFVIVAGIGIWILVLRQFRKQELTESQRVFAGMTLAGALALFFLAMPAPIWVKVIGVAFALFMFFSARHQGEPKRGEGKQKAAPDTRRSAAEEYMPYYKRRQQKQKRSK